MLRLKTYYVNPWSCNAQNHPILLSGLKESVIDKNQIVHCRFVTGAVMICVL